VTATAGIVEQKTARNRPELFACSLPLSCVTTRGRRRTVMTGHHQPEDFRSRRSLSGVRRPEEKTRSDSSPGGFSYGRGVDRGIARHGVLAGFAGVSYGRAR